MPGWRSMSPMQRSLERRVFTKHSDRNSAVWGYSLVAEKITAKEEMTNTQAGNEGGKVGSSTT